MNVGLRRSALLVVVTVLLTMSACNDEDEGAADGRQTTMSSVSPDVSSTTASPDGVPIEPTTDLGDSDETGKSELEDGRHFGYWSTFEMGDTIAFGEFDLASFLTGAEAAAAAAAEGWTVENDYFIANGNPKLRTLIAKGDTEVRVLTDVGGPELESSNVADFAVDRHKDSGFWVTIVDGVVTKIEEQYQP